MPNAPAAAAANPAATAATENTADTTAETQNQEIETQGQETEGQETQETEETQSDGQETGEDGTVEGEEGTEGETKEDSEDISLDDEAVLKLGDSEHTLAEIKEALSLKEEATTRIQQANEAIERSNSVLEALASKPADALVGIFTSIFEGDRQKGYQAVVNLAAKIVNKHMEFQALPEGERKALTLEQELAAAKEKLQTYEQTEQEKAVQEEEAAALEKWTTDINSGLKAAGLKETPKNLAKVAEIIVKAKEAKRTITVADAVAKAKVELAKERQELLSSLDVNELPEEVRKKVSEANIAAAKKKRSPASGAPAADTTETSKKEEPVVYDPGTIWKDLGIRR